MVKRLSDDRIMSKELGVFKKKKEIESKRA